jgi:hypothetical protein
VLRDAGITQVESTGQLANRQLVAPDQPQDALPVGFRHQLKSIHTITLL